MQLKARSSFSGVAYGLGLFLIVLSAGTKLLAGAPSPVPEIDAGSISGALGLLAGGILILRSRRRTK
jgi:hypothetical protein